MALSIVIVNYNAKEYLEQCLRSLVTNDWRAPMEIIVVDNHSQDGSVQMVKEQFPAVTLIQTTRNEGFIKANTEGSESAGASTSCPSTTTQLCAPGPWTP